MCNLIPRGDRVRSIAVAAADRSYLYAGIISKGGKIYVLRPPAGSDDAYAEALCHVTLAMS